MLCFFLVCMYRFICNWKDNDLRVNILFLIIDVLGLVFLIWMFLSDLHQL